MDYDRRPTDGGFLHAMAASHPLGDNFARPTPSFGQPYAWNIPSPPMPSGSQPPPGAGGFRQLPKYPQYMNVIDARENSSVKVQVDPCEPDADYDTEVTEVEDYSYADNFSNSGMSLSGIGPPFVIRPYRKTAGEKLATDFKTNFLKSYDNNWKTLSGNKKQKRTSR